jgi:outer membrane receptor protein involved in Fe transport
MAVTVIGSRLVAERLPNSATDLFTEIRGLDVDGVGTTQRQPMIRGLQGQRILLMEDGLRINNTRRQQERGEIPALIDIGEVDRVEIVRGASSVLYGSDAIGGVINMITPRPGSSSGKSVNGETLLRGGTADGQTLAAAKLFGDFGRMSYRATGSYRSTNAYQAPPGTFGDVTFSENTLVHDTGVDDYSVSGTVGYQFSDRHDGFVKGEAYRSSDTGFGYVDPADLGTDSFVQLLFPRQRFGRLTLGYRGQQLGSVVADNLDVLGYWQNNTRDFHTNIVSPIPPSGELSIESRNFTDIDTYGYRIEAKKLIGGRHILAYGTDLFRDHSFNTDTTVTTVSGFGPPRESVRDVARVPNATFRSMGFFAQATIPLGSRAITTVGARYQNVQAQPEPTPGWDSLPPTSTDDAAVGSINLVVRASQSLNLVGSLGRGFRSPNLVERFFTGAAPDGRGMWIGNGDLAPETSLNAELGLRYRTGRVYLEGFVFQNTIDDAIRAVATGDSVAGVPQFQNVNVDRLRYRGVEIALDVALVGGFAVAGSYTHLSPTNLESPADPLGDGYRDKAVGRLRWSNPGRGLWVEYTIRHNGQREAADLVQGPVGAVIPAFTDHGIRGGVRFLRRQEVVVALTNLTNALYAESANVAFFRPAPKRSLAVTWRLAF